MRGNRLAEIREIYEVSQREVAELLGIGKSAYARWETLERYIPLNRLNDFCNLYKVSMDYAMNLSSINCSTIKKLSIDKKLVGKTVKVLIEDVSEKDNTKVFGYTDTMKLVNVENAKDNIGQIVDVKIIDAKSFSLDGEVL